MTTQSEAKELADAHRIRYGDDVVLHDPDDNGGWFVCTDCDWCMVYGPDLFDDEDDDDSS